MSGAGRIVIPLAVLAALTMVLIAYLVARLRRRRRPGEGYVDYGMTTQQIDPYYGLDDGQHHQHHEHHQGSTSGHGHRDGGHHTSTHDSGGSGGHDSVESGGGGGDSDSGGDSGGGDSFGGGD